MTPTDKQMMTFFSNMGESLDTSLTDEELTLLETVIRESLDSFISESSKATGSEYIARCVDQIKVYESLHDKVQNICLERGSK
tara:strand:+ start:962 stop:1210 length:249 start_codon:yes stop_codon:yes gene_type:complete